VRAKSIGETSGRCYALAGYSALARAAVHTSGRRRRQPSRVLPGFGERLNQSFSAGGPRTSRRHIVRRGGWYLRTISWGDESGAGQKRESISNPSRSRRAQPRSALCEQEYRRPALRTRSERERCRARRVAPCAISAIHRPPTWRSAAAGLLGTRSP